MNVNNNKGLALSHDQKNAISLFKKFLDDDTDAFILQGYAGTGKTTIVKEMISMLKNEECSYSLLASTGRAAKILSDATQNETYTIHSLIYQFKDFNQNLENLVTEYERTGVDSSGQLYLVFMLEPVNDNKKTRFYFVDEASMVSDKEDKRIAQATFGSGKVLSDLFSYDPKGKFIFIGDSCQLPPISQTESPALSASYLQDVCGKKTIVASLTQIMRQKNDNDITVAAQKMRGLYLHPQVGKWAKFPLRGFRNIHLLTSQYELVQKYIERIKKYGYNDSTLICHTNKQCDVITKLVRPALGIMSPTIQEDDLLLITQNNGLTGLMNGDLAKVKSVSVKERRAGLTFLFVSLEEITSKRSCSALMIADILNTSNINLTSAQQKQLFIDFSIRMKARKISQDSETYKIEMQKDPYLNALRAVYGYALTCHKAQGGEWNNVYLDLPRNISAQSKPYVYQWMYTAMTRAKKELYLVDDFYVVSPYSTYYNPR